MRKLFVAIIMGFVLLIFTSCATTPRKQLTREEWLQMTTHQFPGKTVDEVLVAAENVLRLSDSVSDIKIYHLPNKMVGSRLYLVYAVFAAAFGSYNFDVSAYEDKESGSIRTQLLIGDSAQAVAPTMTYTPGVQGGLQGMGVTATTTPVNIGITLENSKVYDLFFKRMESLLYGKPWITCEQAIDSLPKVEREKVNADGYGTITEYYVDDSPYYALCFHADDKSPVK